MKENYGAWTINLRDFYTKSQTVDKLKFLIKFAVLAPSSHNSQPWSFEVSGGQIILSPDFSRALPASDTNHRQLYISLGCALQNILVAADYYGVKLGVNFFPNNHNEIVLTAGQGEHPRDGDKKDHIIFSILTRHTNRSKYSAQIPDSNFLSWLRSQGNQDFKIDIIGSGATKDLISDVVVAANVAATRDKDFRRELSQFLKSNITKSKLGMPMFGFGMPTPISLMAPWFVKNFNVNRLSQKEDTRLLKEFTPTFVVISGRGDTKNDWVRVGQLLESIALNAEREGLRIAPMAAAIQIGEYYKELQKAVNTHDRPLVFFRLGYSDRVTKHSPRLPVGEVIKNDKS